MSSIYYDGTTVNAVVDDIKRISDKFSSLSTNIRAATNKIVSARGFNEYIGGISSDSFSGCVDICREATNQLNNTIRQTQISALAFSQDKAAINAFLDTLSVQDYKQLDLSEIESYIGAGRKIGNFFKGLGASAATAGLGIVEGLLDFGETGADLVTIAGTLFASIFTKGHDLLTGEDTTTQLWNETKARVSEKKVESIFNEFYSDSPIGRSIKENAYGYDMVRSVGKGLGYTAGIIGLNVVTGGLASGGIGAAGSISAGQLAATAGVMGFSNGTEEAWADGATTGKGLLYGVASGAWEGAQWYAGAKINQYGGVGDRVAKGLFKGAEAGVYTRIAMDTVDSGLEGFVQPALTMIYKDYDGANIVEKYTTAFNEAGGWGNVATQAVIGAIGSAVGEFSGARRLLKEAKQADLDVNGKAVGATGALAAGAEGADQVFKNHDIDADVSVKHLGDGDYDSVGRQLADADDLEKAGWFHRKSNIEGDDDVKIFQSSKDRKREFFRQQTPADASRNVEHVDISTQRRMVDQINDQIRREGHATVEVTSTRQLTSSMLAQVDDLSKVDVRIAGGFADLDGNYKTKYTADRYQRRITYSGYEAASIVKRMEGLEARIDMSLPTTERAKQIYEIVSNEYSYSHSSLNVEGGHQVSASLRGMTSNNVLGEEGLVCAGYAQVYKELCNRADVPCEYISGLGLDAYGSGERHAWNVVFGSNGEEIPVDCTWHSGSGEDWFGASDKFARTHQADANEIYRNYSPPVQPVYQASSPVSQIVSTMDSKYGSGSGTYSVIQLLATGDENSITRTNGARDLAKTLSTSDFESYLRNMDSETRTSAIMDYVKNQLIDKYGATDGVRMFENFLTTRDFDRITRTNGARGIAMKWLSPSDIYGYLLTH